MLIFFSCSKVQYSKSEERKRHSIRDSVLIYKVDGLKLFMDIALDVYDLDKSGGFLFFTKDSMDSELSKGVVQGLYRIEDTTAVDRAFQQAHLYLDSVDFNSYEQSLSYYYAAVSQVYYGLSYVPWNKLKIQFSLNNDYDKVEEITKFYEYIPINDVRLPSSDTLYALALKENDALLSCFSFFVLIQENNSFLPKYDDILDGRYYLDRLNSVYPPDKFSRINGLNAARFWYACHAYPAFLSDFKLSQMQNRTGYVQELLDLDKKVTQWYDSFLSEESVKSILAMSDEEFHELELATARYDYQFLKIAAESNKKVKELLEEQGSEE